MTRAAAPDPGGAGHAARRCAVWGVLNVTPDSFSDGGRFLAADAAVARGQELARLGADVVDVGGESSRPRGRTYGAGAAVVPVDEERARVLPVVEGLVKAGIPVSVDTVKAEVAAAALDAGAETINVVAAHPSDALLHVVAEHGGADLVLMHNRGLGEVDGDNVRYDDLPLDLRRELLVQVDRAVAAGIPRERIWLDPGIGFAKTPDQSLAALAAVSTLVATGHRVLVGASRKSFIAALEARRDGRQPGPDDRLGGSIAAATAAVLAGAQAIRVHDVAESRQAVRLAEALWSEGVRPGGSPR